MDPNLASPEYAARVVEQLVDYVCIARERIGLDDLTALNDTVAEGRIVAQLLRELPPTQRLVAIDPAEVLDGCADPAAIDIDWAAVVLPHLFAVGNKDAVARPYLDEHVGVDWLNSAAPAHWVGLSAAYKERHG